MTRFVLDCSMTMAWCFEDEVNRRAELVLDSLVFNEAIVPAIWPLEVANVLLVGERRKRVNGQKVEAFLATLRCCPITVDNETSKNAFGAILDLARTHGLTVYDAAYLELAIRSDCPLASLDARLNEVATKLGIVPFEG